MAPDTWQRLPCLWLGKLDSYVTRWHSPMAGDLGMEKNEEKKNEKGQSSRVPKSTSLQYIPSRSE